MLRVFIVGLFTIFVSQAFAQNTITVENDSKVDNTYRLSLFEGIASRNICADMHPDRNRMIGKEVTIGKGKSHVFVLPEKQNVHYCVAIDTAHSMAVKIDENGDMFKTDCRVTTWPYGRGSCGEPKQTDKGWNINVKTGTI